jgi:hypothetical protein
MSGMNLHAIRQGLDFRMNAIVERRGQAAFLRFSQQIRAA